MNFNLTKPCANCPFRTDVYFYLTVARVAEIISALMVLDQTFACHKTTQFDDDGHHQRRRKDEHCAGAMILMERQGRPNQLMRISERFGGYDHTKLEMDSPVFDTPASMLAEYRKRNGKEKDDVNTHKARVGNHRDRQRRVSHGTRRKG